MSKIKDCASLIVEIMTYSNKDEQIKNECKLNNVLEAMLIFLDYEDMIDILDKRVTPSLLPQTYKRWHSYIKETISCYNEHLEDIE
jgi:hypothetical protein